MRYLLATLLLHSALWADGQNYQVRLKFWGLPQGLSDRQVNAMAKDRQGFLWIGTRSGLNMFDGYQFLIYTRDKDGLPFDDISAITTDGRGMLWLLGPGRHYNNIMLFDPVRKVAHPLPAAAGYGAREAFDYLQQLNDSEVMFGHSRARHFFLYGPSAGLRKIRWSIAPAQIITTTDRSTIWCRDQANFLCEFDRAGRLLRRLRADDAPGEYDQTVNKGIVYVPVTGQDFAQRSQTEVVVRGGRARILHKTAELLINDSLRFTGGRLYSPAGELIGDFATESSGGLNAPLFQAQVMRRGNVWLGNTHGLYQLSVTASRFNNYFGQPQETFSDNSYRNLVVVNGTLYAVNENTGIVASPLHPHAAPPAVLFPAPRSLYYALTRRRNGDLIGMNSDYTFHLPAGTDKWIRQPLRNAPPHFSIWKIYEVSTDSFLLGTNDGLRWFRTSTNTIYPYERYNRFTQLAHAVVLDIVPDRHGIHWVCANTGLYALGFQNGVVSGYSSEGEGGYYLPAREFQHFYEDRQGLCWLATTNGLIRWNRKNGRYRRYGREDGLSNNNIYAVYEDAQARLWLSSDYGLMSFDKASGSVNAFQYAEGVSYNEFNRVSHTRDSAGNLYFGTLNGITSFNPDRLPRIEEKRATLAVTYFRQFNGRTERVEDKTPQLLSDNQITVRPGDRYFTLGFSLLSFHNALQTTYAWKLEGVDTGWNNIREPVLRLSGLPYGDWKLRIRARSGDARPGRNELLFDVHVVKPVYLRFWFLATAVLLSVALILWWYRWQLGALRRENEKLDYSVKRKTQALEQTISELQVSSSQKDDLLKEIHHRVKNNLQVISTLLNLQLSKVSDETVRASLGEGISRISSIALIHHHLYKSEALTAIELSGFTAELVQQISSVYARPGQSVSFHNGIPPTLLDIDTAMPVGLLLNELMTNSYKYAYKGLSKGIIDIRLWKEESIYTLRYQDNGPGLPDNFDFANAKTLGIVLVRSLARQLGGTLSWDGSRKYFTITFLEISARKRID